MAQGGADGQPKVAPLLAKSDVDPNDYVPCWLSPDGALSFPDAELPKRCDVAIVGAGYTGLSATLALAKRGITVAVLEAATIGWGASSRNGGMVLSGLKLGPRELVATFGPERARRFDAASIAAIEMVAKIVHDEAIDCDLAFSGHIALAAKPRHYDSLQKDCELVASAFGRTLRLLPKQSIKEEVGSDAFWGGLVDDASASLQPAKYVFGLAAAAERAGALLCSNARVDAIERVTRNGSAVFRFTTSRGIIESDQALLATGAYTGRQFPIVWRRVLPLGSYIIATKPLDPDLARSVSPRGRMMFDTKHFLHYFRLTPDGRFLFGGRASFVPESPGAVRESAAILRQDMLKLFPQLADVSVDRSWGGTIDFTFDMLPHAGCLNGIYFALGYAGHGVAMATHLGTQIGRWIAGEPRDETFMTQPLPNVPLGLHNGGRWALPLAGAWFKFLDLVA